jgi:hypothetical protein
VVLRPGQPARFPSSAGSLRQRDVGRKQNPLARYCSESSFVDANFGSGWAIGLDTATQCVLSIEPTEGFAKTLAFEGVLPAPASAEDEWHAAPRPGADDTIWVLPHFGRPARDGSSALGEIPGTGRLRLSFGTPNSQK